MHELLYPDFCGFEAARRGIPGQHALGNVERDQYVGTFLSGRRYAHRLLRIGHGTGDQGQREAVQDDFKTETPGGKSQQQALGQLRRPQLLQRSASPLPIGIKYRTEQGYGPKEIQQGRIFETHLFVGDLVMR